jgi:DNA invertase Pin-like site-specific DNA recombinase
LSYKGFIGMEYIAYCRTSTKEQNNGLEAQQNAIQRFIDSDGGILVDMFIEQVSGAENDRIELNKALALCTKHGYTLLIHKLDRLSRRVSFIANLMETKINLKVCTIPNADNFQLHLFSALAEQERAWISSRTKEALAVRKAAGVKLGCPLNDERAKEASSFAISMKATIESIKSNGIVSMNGIAKELNRLEYPTRSGGAWYAKTISNYMDKIAKAA